MYRTLLLLVSIGFLPLLATAQLQVSFPVSRAILQRNSANEAIIHIAGNFSNRVNRIDARVQARDGQGTSSDWTTIQVNPGGGVFAGDLTVRGGWYDLQVRGIYGDQVVNISVVERIGVGEVFIIAGQSNAQGVYDDMASASDDRVNCLNYYDGTESQSDPPVDVFNRFTHVNQGTRIAPRGIGTWCWGRLGDLLTQRLNVPILFFNAAYTGTAIRNWLESIERGRAESIYVPGTYYADGQPYANLRQTIQFYTHMLGVRAILWHQGEAENFVNTSYESYVNDLGAIINRSRQESNKNIVWMVARASYSGDSRRGRAEVIAAQNQVIASIPNVYAGPSTDGIQIPRQRPPRTELNYDDVHFDVNGLEEVANAWNNSLTDSFFASSIPQPPVQAPTISVNCSTENRLSISVNGSFSSVNWNSGETSSTIVKGVGSYQAKIKDGAGNVLLSPVILVANAPTIQTSGPTTFCAGGNVTLTSSYGNNNTWSTSATGQQLQVMESGNYSVRYQDVSGCTFVSSPVTVQVNPLPAMPRIAASSSTTFCQGESTTLSTAEQASYQWNSGQTSRSIDVRTPGDYIVTVTDQNGCSSPTSSVIKVVVNPLPPTPSITASRSTTFCADQQLNLTATEEQAYEWTSGQAARAITINQSGTFSVRTRNNFNCFSALSTPVVVQVNPLPQAPSLTASGRTVFCAGDQVSLTANSALKAYWSTGDSLQTITVRQSGSYSARVRDANGCDSPLSTAVLVDVKPMPSVPMINQVGTYTLEATASLSGDFYRWILNTDTLLVSSAIIKASRSGLYTVQSFIRYNPSLTCGSALSSGLNFTVDERNQGLSIYPNPSPTKAVSVETLANLTNAIIIIYTQSGEEVATFSVPTFEEPKRLDLTALMGGIYILQVKAQNFNIRKRFILGGGN